MVKKKTNKKKNSSSKKSSVKKKTAKKKTVKKGKSKSSSEVSISKKDFEAFKFGVERLKELKAELDSLDTRGFSKEAQSIQSKLKKVSEIPNIEKELKTLKKKISGKYKPKRKKGPSTKKVLDEGLEDIEEEIVKLRRSRKADIGEIQEQLKKLQRMKKEQQKTPVDSGVGILVDTNFNRFLEETKQALSKRVREREEEIDETLKMDLEKRQDTFKKKHDSLLKEFENKKKKLEEEYKKKYNLKLKTTLHKEVVAEFNKKLKEKFDAENVKLGKEYVEQLRAHSKLELENRKKKLEDNLKKELAQKMSELDEEFRKKIEKEESEEKRIKENLEKEKKSLEEKMREEKSHFEDYSEKEKERLQKAKQDFVLNKEKERKEMRDKIVNAAHMEMQKELAKKEAILKKQLQNEFDLKLKKQVREHEEKLKKRKLDLELEMQKKIKQLLN
jgi:hypothetical protein